MSSVGCDCESDAAAAGTEVDIKVYRQLISSFCLH